MRALTLVVALFSFATFSACSESPEALLKEQSDQVCKCDSFDCAMGVLKGPINQKLKTMKGEISEEGRKEKARMMKCILDLKAAGK